jgi:hypothetical protein
MSDPRRSRAHKRLRDAYAATLPTPCFRCGRVVHQGEEWDLDHEIPVVHGGGAGPVHVSHSLCNRKHGRNVRRRPNAPPSREW